MRKLLRRVLPVALVLCLALSQMSVAAWAIDSSNIDRDSAMIVTEDTTITGEVHQLVLVDAPVKVDVSDATLSVGIFVSPDAAEAQVNITGETTVAEVVVAAESASVTVAETAAVESVTVDAPSATLEVAGEVKSVTVSESAEGASVVVAETAKVSTLEVSAPNVTAEVAGTVETVTVAETAAGAELVVAETATVGAVTDATGELTVSGAGADSVAVEDTSAPAEEEAEEETEDEKSEETTDSTDSGFVDFDVTLTPGETEDDGNGPTQQPDDGKKPDDGTGSGDGDGDGDVNKSEYAPKITWGTTDSDSASTETTTVGTPKIEVRTTGDTTSYWVGFCVKVTGVSGSEDYTYTVAVKDGSKSTFDSTDNFIWIDITTEVTAAITAAANGFDIIKPADGVTNANVEKANDDAPYTLVEDALDDTTVTIAAESASVKVTLTVTGEKTVDSTDAGDDSTNNDVQQGQDDPDPYVGPFDYEFTVSLPTGDLTKEDTTNSDFSDAVTDALTDAVETLANAPEVPAGPEGVNG